MTDSSAMASPKNKNSDDDDLPEVRLTPLRDKNSSNTFQVDTIVWAWWKDDYWPALIRTINKPKKKAAVVFIDQPTNYIGKELRLSMAFKKLIKFDSSEKSTELKKSADENKQAKIDLALEYELKRISGNLSVTPIEFFKDPICDSLTKQRATKKSQQKAESPTTKSPTVKIPKAESPTTKSPTTKSPTTKSPTVKVPTVKSPTAKSPTAKSPTAKSPTAKSPTAMSPTVKSPTVKSPTVKSPTVKSPTVKSPTVKSPTVKSPTVKVPTVKVPTAKVPTAKVPTAKVPPTKSPPTKVPPTKSPTVKIPTTGKPTAKRKLVEDPILPQMEPLVATDDDSDANLPHMTIVPVSHTDIELYEKLINVIKSEECEKHLTRIRQGEVECYRHKLHSCTTPSKRQKLKFISFSRIMDDKQMDALVRHFREVLTKQLAPNSKKISDTAKIINYVMDVWVPEALSYGLQSVFKISSEAADEMIQGKK